MKVLVNISHPAHVHFFKNAIAELTRRGHRVIVGARKKEFTLQLLKEYRIEHVLLTRKGNGFWGLLREMCVQQLKLFALLRKEDVDIMLQIGGIFNAPVGRLIGIPTLAFSDTENDTIANKISFSLSRHVLSPSCFDHKLGGSWKNQIHYPGYHELAYLSPTYQKAAIQPGENILLRFVGWGAGHDIGEVGLSDAQKIELVRLLESHGKIYISSEGPLPDEIEALACAFHPARIHDFMRTCKFVIGESATMASEAACLGIPAIFISNTGRGYTTEQDTKYDLIRHYRLDQWPEVVTTLNAWVQTDSFDIWQQKRRVMLRDKMEVTDWLVDLVENYPDSLMSIDRGRYKRIDTACVE